MGKAKLRKKLEGLPKENIIRVVMALYDASKEARHYLDFYAEPNSKNESANISSTSSDKSSFPHADYLKTLRLQLAERLYPISTTTLRFGRPHAVLHRNGL